MNAAEVSFTFFFSPSLGVVLGVLYMGGNLIARGEMDAGQLMAFLVATQAVHRSLAQISLLFGHVVRGSTAAGRISEVRGRLY